MKSYYELIKEKIINFDKLLLERYYNLGLSEVECIVLLRLYQYQETINNSLNTKELVKKLSISEDCLGEIIVNLVNKDFISLVLDNNNSNSDNKFLEVFSLEGAYRQLGYILEDKELVSTDNEKSLEMKKMIASIEERLKKILTPNEILTIKKWFYEYKYSIDIINEELDKAVKRKAPTVNMIDRALYVRTKAPADTDKAIEAQKIFNKIYGKK